MTTASENKEPSQIQGLAISKSDRAGSLKFAMPEVGNRLTLAMRASLDAGLRAFGTDPQIYCAILEAAAGAPFSEGDDWVDLRAAAGTGPDLFHAALASAYQGLWRVDRFSKPFVSLIEGPAAWAGTAIALCGTHKVADPAATFIVGDVANGWVPGWGASFRLPALPGHLGLYLALTGASLDSALAYRLGWVTHRIPASHFPACKVGLSSAEPVDPLLDGLDQGSKPSNLDPVLADIEHCFSGGDIGAILSRLESIAGSSADWAGHAAAAIRRADPLALAAAHRLLTTYRQPDLRKGLIMDFRVAMNWVAERSSLNNLDTLFSVPEGGDLELPIVLPPSIS